MKTFSLPQLAAELDMSPKTCRANLRKSGYKRPGTRWVWPTDQKATIKAIARGKAPPVVAKKVGRPRKSTSHDAHTSH